MQVAVVEGQHKRTITSLPTKAQNILVLLLALTTGTIFLDRFGITFIFPELKAELGLSNAQLGSLMAATSFAWAISSIVFAYISDALGGRAKLFIVSGLVIFSMVTSLTGLMTTFMGLIIVRVLIGIFEGPMIPLIQSTVLRISSPKRLGINLAVVIAGGSLLGMALPPVIISALTESVGWRQGFLYLAVPGLLLALVLAFVLQPDREVRSARRQSLTLKDALGLLAIRNVKLAAIGAAALIGLTITMASFLPLFLTDVVKLTSSMQITVLTAFGLAGGVGGVLMPTISDRFSRRKCLIIACAAGMIALALMAMSPTAEWLLVLALVGWFIGGGALTLMVYIIPGESVPTHLTATAYAVLLAVGELAGGSTMPAFGGFLADRFGVSAAIWFSAVLGAIALIVATAMREPVRRT